MTQKINFPANPYYTTGMNENKISKIKAMRLSHKTIAQIVDLMTHHKSRAWIEALIDKQWNKI